MNNICCCVTEDVTSRVILMTQLKLFFSHCFGSTFCLNLNAHLLYKGLPWLLRESSLVAQIVKNLLVM